MPSIDPLFSPKAIPQLDTIIQKMGLIKTEGKALKDLKISFGDSKKVSKEINEIATSTESLKTQQDDYGKTVIKVQKLNNQYVDSITALNKEKEKAIAKTKKEEDANIRAAKKISTAKDKEAKKIEAANDKIAKAEKEHRDALNLVVKTEEEALRQNKALRIERKKLNATTEDGKKDIKENNALIDANTELIEGNADKNQERINGIGLYESALAGLPVILQGVGAAGVAAATGLAGAGAAGATTSAGFVSIGAAGKKAAKALWGTVKAAIAFILTPLGAILAVIALVIAEVSAAFQKFQPLMDALTQATAALSAGMEVALTALGKVGKVIISTVVLSLQKMRAGILKARIAWNEFTGDDEEAEKLKTKLQEVNDAIEETTAKLKEEAADAEKSWRGLGSAIADAAKEGAAIKALEQQADQFRITSIKTNAELENQISTLERIADDATRSFAKREDAANKLDIVQQKLADRRVKETLLNEQVQIRTANNIRKQRALTRAEEETLNEAIAARINTQTESEAVALENTKRLSELKQDRLEKDLDILIDGFDNQKTINERIIANDKETFDKRFDLLDETKNLAKTTFDEQIATIQQFTDDAIDANDLLATSDAKQLNEKIRGLGLSEIIEGRLLEVVRERRIVNQDLADSERDLNDKRIENEKATTEILLRSKQREFDERIEIARKSSKTEEEFQKKVFKINNEIIEQGIKDNETLLANTETTELEKLAIKEDIADQELELKKLKNAEEFRLDEEKTRKQIELINRVHAATTTIVNAGFDYKTNKRNEELQILEGEAATEEEKLDAKAESDLAKVEGNSKAEAAIEKKLAEDKKALANTLNTETNKIRSDQDKANRKQALFNIGIDTIATVAKTLTHTGFTPAGLIAAGLAVAAGAAQALIVSSAPLPAYKHGTKSSAEGLARVSEGNKPELAIEKSGKMFMTPDKDSVINLKGGTEIVPHHKIINRLHSKLQPNPMLGRKDNDIAWMQGVRILKRAIENQSSSESHEDFNSMMTKGNSMIDYINDHYRHL